MDGLGAGRWLEGERRKIFLRTNSNSFKIKDGRNPDNNSNEILRKSVMMCGGRSGWGLVGVFGGKLQKSYIQSLFNFICIELF